MVPETSPSDLDSSGPTTPTSDTDPDTGIWQLRDRGPRDRSPSSSGSSKDEQTPKAEIPPLLMSSNPAAASSTFGAGRRRDGLERSASWKKRHASLDAPPVLPSSHSSYFPAFAPNLSPPRPSRSAQPETNFVRSSSSGCYISAPKLPPAHYPTMPVNQLNTPSGEVNHGHESPKEENDATPALCGSSASTVSSMSSASTPPDSFQESRWQKPGMAHRSGSFGTAMDCPDVLVAEDVEEVTKGEDARISVHTRKESYEVWASLPGFEHENIIVSTKQARTLHIVADNWDQADHAQWDIKLGDDAQMSSIRAIFKGNYLHVIIPRRTAASSASTRSSGSRATNTSGKSDRDRDLLGQRKEKELEQAAKDNERQQATWMQACARKNGAGWDAAREKREMEAKMGGLFCWGKSKDGAAG